MVAAIAAAGGIAWKRRNAAQPSIQSIAILPLKNLGDASDEATIDGLSNGLSTTVAQLTNATVISQDSAARYKTSPKSLQEMGRELGVDAIVSGFAERADRRIQVVTQLTDVATSRQLWTQTFENEPRQLPLLQADIAAALLVEVDSRRTTPEQEARLEKLRTVKPEVYDACLKGGLLWRRGDVPSAEKAIPYFQEAIRQDPNYAPAYVGLADAYRILANNLTSTEAWRLSSEALMKALSLDPKLGEAHAALSYIKLHHDLDFQAAEREAKLGIALSPNDASAHVRYIDFLITLHRLDEAIAEIKRAQRLDPLSSTAQNLLARYFAHKKDYDRAIQEWRKAIELEPNNSWYHQVLAATYGLVGRYTEALAEAQRAYELSGVPGDRAQIALMLAHLGKTDEAEKIIEEIKDRSKSLRKPCFRIARTYAVLKRKEETFRWLEYLYEARGLFPTSEQVSEMEEFEWLRSDPRFQDLVTRLASAGVVGTAQPDPK
jgi:TolB-like protein/Flp pilus assembly protein TadD